MELKKCVQRVSLPLLVAVLSAVFFFGLRPNGYDFSNHATRLPDPGGLRFEKYAIAYTDPFAEGLHAREFSIQIVFRPTNFFQDGFNFIAVLHDGDDRRQLLMAQWRSYIVFMNGDDYDHRRKTKRIYVDAAQLPTGPLSLTVTSGENGTRLYCGGALVQEDRELRLTLPGDPRTRLLLANSAYGMHPWEGEIYRLAIHGVALEGRAIASDLPRSDQGFPLTQGMKERTLLLYCFDEKTGRRVLDHACGSHHLFIPQRMDPPARRILAPEWGILEHGRGGVQDIVLNLIGFVPLGFFLSAVLNRSGGRFSRRGVLIAVVLGFSVSLFIEIVQAWIPSRSSSMSDLLLNTLGTWLGALAFRLTSFRTKVNLAPH
jgi:hypothetical protein